MVRLGKGCPVRMPLQTLAHSGLLNRGPLPTRQSPPTVHILVVTCLECPPEGPLVTIAHKASACWGGSGGGVWGVRRRRVRGTEPRPDLAAFLSRDSPPPHPDLAASSLGIFHLRSRGPRGARALCLRPGIGHVSAEAPRAAPEAPLLLAAPPAQPLAQAHQCGDSRFVLPRMPGESESPTPRTAAVWPGRRSGRPNLGCTLRRVE